MKRFACLALALVLAAPAASGHIGDDLAQLRQAYGATGKQAGNTMIFQSNGYSIAVYFDGDHSAMEVFTRDGSVKNKTDITPDDIKSILALESDGQPWYEVESKSGKPTWLRADDKLIARLSPGDSTEDKVFMVMVNQK
jgi:Ca2+-binding RTX toxin-like protein